MTTKINNKLALFFNTFYHNIANNYISESHESSTFESFKAYFYSSNSLFTKKLRKQGMALSAFFLTYFRYYILVTNDIFYKLCITNILKIKVFFYIHFNKIPFIIYLAFNTLRICPTFVYCGDENMYFVPDLQQNTQVFLMKKQDAFIIDQVNKTVRDATEAFAKQEENLETASKIHLTQRIPPIKVQAIHKHLQNPQLIEKSTNLVNNEQSNKLDPKILEHSFKDLTTTNMPTKDKSAILNPAPITLSRVARENARFGVAGTFGVGAMQALEIPSKVLETTTPILPHIYQNPITGETVQNIPIKLPRRDIMNTNHCCIS